LAGREWLVVCARLQAAPGRRWPIRRPHLTTPEPSRQGSIGNPPSVLRRDRLFFDITFWMQDSAKHRSSWGARLNLARRVSFRKPNRRCGSIESALSRNRVSLRDRRAVSFMTSRKKPTSGKEQNTGLDVYHALNSNAE
jgi:hypothetical protein